MNAAERRTTACEHKSPICTVIGIKVFSRKPKQNGMVRGEEFRDCAICGPHSFVAEFHPVFLDGKLIRSIFTEPYRKLGQPRNAVMRNRG